MRQRQPGTTQGCLMNSCTARVTDSLASVARARADSCSGKSVDETPLLTELPFRAVLVADGNGGIGRSIPSEDAIRAGDDPLNAVLGEEEAFTLTVEMEEGLDAEVDIRD